MNQGRLSVGSYLPRLAQWGRELDVQKCRPAQNRFNVHLRLPASIAGAQDDFLTDVCADLGRARKQAHLARQDVVTIEEHVPG